MDKKVLVVDDEENILSLLRKFLTDAGYTVYSAGNGKQALEILKHEKIQVFFLDLKMRNMDGVELCQKIKKDNPKACAYAMTVYPTLYTKEACLKAGFEDYFRKPFSSAVLVEATQKAFKKLQVI